ncbi:DUF397 domain-containing protein [Streptomyces sp. NPDC090032]|uniref:DUF397 domain-containing protein n=1 Tax=Streptomyces sp. NPDC090032 TaxID=3365925 RepID=UPI00381A1F34
MPRTRLHSRRRTRELEQTPQVAPPVPAGGPRRARSTASTEPPTRARPTTEPPASPTHYSRLPPSPNTPGHQACSAKVEVTVHAARFLPRFGPGTCCKRRGGASQHPHFDAAPALRCGRGPWFKSPYSSGDNCLESARVPRVVPVRDSKLSLTEKTSGPLPTAGLDAIHHEHQGPRTPVYLIPTQSCCPLQSQ